MKDIIKIDCKYYLSCGRCDKTNGLCSMLDEIELPVKSNERQEIMNNTEAIEQAIKELTEIKLIYCGTKDKALELAIKALEFIDENFPKTFIDYLNGEQI